MVNVSRVTGRRPARARVTQLIGINGQRVAPGWPDMPDTMSWGVGENDRLTNNYSLPPGNTTKSLILTVICMFLQVLAVPS